MNRLENWCSYLQAANDQLQQDIRYLSQKCELFDGQCANLYDWKDHFVNTCLNVDKEMNKLESFSRSIRITYHNMGFFFFTNMDYTACPATTPLRSRFGAILITFCHFVKPAMSLSVSHFSNNYGSLVLSAKEPQLG